MTAEMQPNEEALDNAFSSVFRQLDISGIVLMASTFRSGSSYTASLIARNGLKGLGLERFNRAAQHRCFRSADDIDSYLRPIVEPFRGTMFPAKIMWPHRSSLARALNITRESSARFAQLFPSARWVFVYREDQFAQAVSFWRAKKSNRWHTYRREAEPEPSPEYRFDEIAACLHELVLHEALWRDFFQQSGIAPLEICYERLVSNVDVKLRKILGFLGLPRQQMVRNVNLKRQSDPYSRECIARFLDDLYRPGAAISALGRPQRKLGGPMAANRGEANTQST